MKIYELASDLSVDKEALLFLAQKQGINAKSIAYELTSDESDNLLQAFDEVGGNIEPIEKDLSKISEVESKESKEDFTEASLKSDLKYEAPRKKKKFFKSGKENKNKGVKLQKQNYERPTLPKPYSQKGARIPTIELGSVLWI